MTVLFLTWESHTWERRSLYWNGALFVSSWSRFCRNTCCFCIKKMIIRFQFCTCHNGSVVVTCKKHNCVPLQEKEFKKKAIRAPKTNKSYKPTKKYGGKALCRRGCSWNLSDEFGKSYLAVMLRLDTLRPRQNGCHFADDSFKCIFLNENAWISIEISLKFVPKGPINNISSLVQIMAWRRSGDKPLSEPMMVSLLTHICINRPQWVNKIMLKTL